MQTPSEKRPTGSATQTRSLHDVQVLRTYSCAYARSSGCYSSFAPRGETSVFQGLLKAVRAARHFIYIEVPSTTPKLCSDRFHADAFARGVAPLVPAAQVVLVVVRAHPHPPE